MGNSVTEPTKFSLPSNFNWQLWVDRWDRMQERYLVRRKERFAVMASLIQTTQPSQCRILDLGCGPGSTMYHLLKSLPEAQIFGIELDLTILALAEPRLKKFGERAKLIHADLRHPDWYHDIQQLPINAVVSATTLHWFNEQEQAKLYKQIAHVLSSGGIFLNADHVPNSLPSIQQYWESHREKMRKEEGYTDADNWDGFRKAYSEALGIDPAAIQKSLLGEWKGVELPLAWHFDHLRASGFIKLDCYWRIDCDAVYGGIRK